MAEPVSVQLANVSDAMRNAEDRAGDLWSILTVLSMAIGSEDGVLDPDQRAGLETVIGHATAVACTNLEAVSTTTGALQRFLATHT